MSWDFTELFLENLSWLITPGERSSESRHFLFQVDRHLSPELPGVDAVVAVLQCIHPAASVRRRPIVAPRKTNDAGGDETPQVSGFVEFLGHRDASPHGDLRETLGFRQAVPHGVLPVLSAGRPEEGEATLDVLVDLSDRQTEIWRP